MAVLKLIAHGCDGFLRRCQLARWVCALGVICLAALPARAEDPPQEYQLKAVFLFRFAQFVDWPEAAFPDAHAPIVFAVLGKNPFGDYLDNLLRDEHIGDRPVIVRRCSRVEELAGCHLVFISRSESRELEAILAKLKNQPVLTVSDADTFTRAGGMVRFAMEGDKTQKVRLRINVDAAKASQLTISSKVLRPDTIVTQGKD
jgi:hypothetical protein